MTGAEPFVGRPIPIGSAEYDGSRFASGHTALDDWIRTIARRAEGRTARTYVVVAESGELAAYYCLATGAVARAASPRKLRKDAPDPIPVAIIGRLAVSQAFARRGIGSGLLQDAFRRIVQIADIVGCTAVLAHAIDAEAAGFYRKYGFNEFPDGTRAMFLAVAALQTVVGEPS
ncbi:MAG: GNAT family N-acetyltransferase [Bauldia sp.]|nr:GNAT family N-acetyltransferase [Bauldia sp.]